MLTLSSSLSSLFTSKVRDEENDLENLNFDMGQPFISGIITVIIVDIKGDG